MLINGSRLKNFPVLSLHMGGPVAWTDKEVIDPETLKIVAFLLRGPLVGRECGEILDMRDVREFEPTAGMIVDSADDFSSRGDVIKIDKILKLNFNLVGLKVETKKGAKLGKISDYTLNADDFTVQQLIVQRPALKGFLDPELIIGREQIVEVTDFKIIVKEEKSKSKTTAKTSKKDFVPNFVNPFREPDFAPAQSRNPGEQDN